MRAQQPGSGQVRISSLEAIDSTLCRRHLRLFRRVHLQAYGHLLDGHQPPLDLDHEHSQPSAAVVWLRMFAR